MRFQAKTLLFGAAIVGVSALGYAAGHDHSMHGHAALSLGLSGHGHADQDSAAQKNVLGLDKPAAPSDKYTCPMHPEVVADAPGRCPICGMHLVKVAQEHADHGHEHAAPPSAAQGHDHSMPEQAAQSHGHSMHEHTAQGHDHSAHDHATQSSVAQKNILGLDKPATSSDKYTCPMHPAIVTDAPGACPICGMNLVKIVQGESEQKNAQVHVDMQTQQRMGVQWQTAGVAGMHRAIDTYSTIAPDQTRSVSVSSFVEGWIKRWHVQGVGQSIKKGQVLYEVYSPDLQQRQREYLNLLTRLDAMQANSGGMGMSGGSKPVDMSGPSFVMMRALAKDRFRTRDRLLTAGIPASVLEQIEKHRRIEEVVPIQATQDGIVTEVSAREGSYINPAQPLLVYTDNSRVWAEITLYPDQIGWLKNGDEVTLTSSLDTTVQARSQVDISNLQIDPASRTAKLRLPVPNAGGAFYPGSYAKATIKTGERHVLSVPRDAVIRTGHGQYVVVSESQNHFRSVQVETGIENKHAVEIRSGLEPGAKVVINGQFLLDAAASLQSMQNRLAAAVPSSGLEAAEAAPQTVAARVPTHSRPHP